MEITQNGTLGWPQSYTITDEKGEKYIYVPEEFANKGLVGSGYQFYNPGFLKKDAFEKAQSITLPSNLSVSNASWAYSNPNKGFVWKAEDYEKINPKGFDNIGYYTSEKYPAIEGISTFNGDVVYKVPTEGGYQASYITGLNDKGNTNFRSTRMEGGSSIFGDVLGDWFDDFTTSTGIADLAGGVNDFFKTDLGKAVLVGSAVAGSGMFGGTEAAGAGAGAGTTGTTEGGLLSGAGSTGTGLQATGGLGLTGGNTANLAAMGGAQGLTTAGTTGSALGATGGALTAGGIGAGIGLSEAATGTGSLLGTGAAAGAAGAAATGGLTAEQMRNAGLISGGLNLAGGLLQGKTSQDAANQLAAQQAALAEKTLQMGKFQPVGVTTRFGTSSFTTDPVTGAITPSYTLSPEAKAYQDALSGMATQSLTAGQGLMNLGQQYIGESPEAVRNRYIQTQQALLAPQQEQSLAAIRARQAATGRGGLAFGATSDGMMATNPEMAAYYNSLAQTQRQLAANAETQYQNQVNFGTGLLGGATTPFTNVFNTQKSVETAGQQPLGLATDFANTVATRGAAQGANYANAMSPSLQAQYNANNYNPYATALQGAGNNRYFIDSNLVSGNV